MMKNCTLAASIVMLTTISGQTFAEAAAPNAEATSHSDPQAVYAFNAFDRAVATETAEQNAYRYHGGPKSND